MKCAYFQTLVACYREREDIGNMETAGCSFSLEMTFSSEAEKDAFKLRVDSARRILFPDESTSQRPDNAALLNAMLDIVL